MNKKTALEIVSGLALFAMILWLIVYLTRDDYTVKH